MALNSPSTCFGLPNVLITSATTKQLFPVHIFCHKLCNFLVTSGCIHPCFTDCVLGCGSEGLESCKIFDLSCHFASQALVCFPFPPDGLTFWQYLTWAVYSSPCLTCNCFSHLDSSSEVLPCPALLSWLHYPQQAVHAQLFLLPDCYSSGAGYAPPMPQPQRVSISTPFFHANGSTHVLYSFVCSLIGQSLPHWMSICGAVELHSPLSPHF